MWIVRLLVYARLKVLATIIRTVVATQIWVRRNILRTLIDWEVAYPRVSRVYTIPSSEKSSRDITIRVWDPPAEFAAKGLRPVHINFHGSGYLIPSLGNDSDFCELLSKKLGITVLDCDYAKAPERPFPHAYNQVKDILYHVLAQPNRYDLSNLTIGGFSAGAGLATCTVANESLAQERVKALVAVYCPGDLSNPPDPPPRGPPGSTAPVLSPFVIDTFNSAYSSGGYSLADPRISPTKNTYTGFKGKKAIVIRGEYDNLCEHGKELAEKLEEGGVDVKCYLIQDVGHAWDKTARTGTWEHDRKTQAYEYVLEFLKDVYAEEKAS